MEVLSRVGEFDGVMKLRPWDEAEIPQYIENMHQNDHHHNIVRKLHLLPPSPRGNVIRKALAFFHLQSLLGVCVLQIVPHASASEAWSLLQTQGTIFKLCESEYYVMSSLIRLIDAMVGNEPFLDFNPTKLVYIEHLKERLVQYKEAKLSNLRLLEKDVWLARDLVVETMARWEDLKQRHNAGKQSKISNYYYQV